jgi:hypothetical protein
LFKARGLDLSSFFLGTLNIDIRPLTFDLARPEFTFRDVRWTDLHPPEHFSFSRCRVSYKKNEYPGWLYFPHPETKRRNFQDPSLFEVIADWIAEIKHAEVVEVLVNPERVLVARTGDAAV